MAVQQLSTYNNALKRVYTGPLRNQLNNAHPIVSRLRKNREDARGDSMTAYIAAIASRNQGIGWIGEGDTLPTAGKRRYGQPTVAMAYGYCRVQISGQAIVGSSNSATRFASVIDEELDGAVQGLKVNLSKHAYRRGTGALAKFTGEPDAVVASTLIKVDDASCLEEDMVVDSFSTNGNSGGTAGDAGTIISEVDYPNNKIAFSTNYGAGAEINYFLYQQTTRGKVPMGLEGLVDGYDSAGNVILTTFQGIGVTAANGSYFLGNVIDNAGALTDLTLDDLQKTFELGEYVGGEQCSAIYTTYALRRKYLNLVAADKRYVNSLKLDGGWSALEYSGGGEGVPIIADRHCIPNTMFFLCEKNIQL